MRRFTRFLLPLALAVLCAAPARAQSKYTFKDLGSISPDGHSEAQGVNDSGHATGMTGYSPYAQAFYWNGISMIGCGRLPGHTGSIGYGINNADEVVGQSSQSAIRRGFVWFPTARAWNPALPPSTSIDLNSLLSVEDAAHWVLQRADAINNSSQVSGWGSLDGADHGFLFDLRTGTLTDLGAGNGTALNQSEVAGAPNPAFGAVVRQTSLGPSYLWRNGTTTAIPIEQGIGINDSGAVVGFNSNGTNGPFYWDGISATARNILGSYYSAGAAALNSSVIVGTGQKTRLALHTGIRWRVGDTSPQDLNSIASGLGKLKIIHANGISGNGFIAGEDWDGKSTQHACILTPVP